MLLAALILLLLFGGLGFAVHVLWWGLILALVVGVADLFLGGSRRV